LTVGIRKPLVILPERLLREADNEVLTSAIGHELVHVQRRDYLLNLIYELVYLPLSFHPAAALMRRRINQTRELSCDELVTRKLLTAEIYAHSLVQLAGSAVPFSRHASLTVGITDADILEVRIMTILRKSKLSTGRARLLMIAASLLLAMPCVATAAFGLAFDITLQEPAIARDEGNTKGTLVYRTEPEYTEDARAKKIEGTVGLLASIDSNGSVDKVQVTKPLYPSLDRSAAEALKKWRFEPLVRDGKPAAQQFHVEMLFSTNGYQEKLQPAKMEQDPKQSSDEKAEMEKRREMERINAQMRELKERAEHDLRFKAEYEEQLKRQTDSQYQAELVARDRRMEEERKAMAIANATLARTAKISMEQAIQIANGQYPGKVMECSLVGQGWESPGKLSKDGRVLYHVVIITSDENNPVFTHVWVNAVDGTIHKTEKAEGRNETRKATPISGGILNGKAISMPVPAYPMVARNVKVSGAVMVQVLVDEGGDVISAYAVSGHPLLQAAAVDAARKAKFSPTLLQGEPVKINGVLTYNFVAQ
jgi:TonB family protein